MSAPKKVRERKVWVRLEVTPFLKEGFLINEILTNGNTARAKRENHQKVIPAILSFSVPKIIRTKKK